MGATGAVGRMYKPRQNQRLLFKTLIESTPLVFRPVQKTTMVRLIFFFFE